MVKLEYERFIRKAFGLKLNNGSMIDRWEDPASLANADKFEPYYINKVKAGIIYSMETFIIDIANNEKIPNDTEDARLESFADLVMNAPDLSSISNIIKDFNNTVLDVYYDYNNGVMTLK